MERISRLKNICEGLKEPSTDTDKNFWAVNMHGDELPYDFTIPKGIRIIMFCYSGRRLHICPRFDRFNWQEIFMNEDASFNYCTFISNIVQYSSLRDHFCVYEQGQSIRDLVFTPDPFFRSGIYSLPVYGSVYEPESNTIFTSSDKTFHKTVEQSINVKKITVDKTKTANLIKGKDFPAMIFSSHFEPNTIKLSELVNKLSSRIGSSEKHGFTLLLMTCRTGEERRLSHPRTVYEELEKMYAKYKKISNK